KSYLAQEGLSTEELASGKKVLLVDTGYEGSISETIEAQFPSEYRAQISTHLIVSGTPNYPLSRVFLNKLNIEFDILEPWQYQPVILAYEHLPSFTDRSTDYEKVDNRWEPMS